LKKRGLTPQNVGDRKVCVIDKKSYYFGFVCAYFFRSKGIWEARLVFFVVLLMNLIAVIKWLHFSKEKVHILPEKCKEMSVKSVQTFQMSWTLLITLVLRTHNTLLVAMVIVQEALLWRFVVKKIKLPAKYLAILCWWMGQTVFFQQVIFYI
jgi:hypothetical protein